jgi:hypothetical protein
MSLQLARYLKDFSPPRQTQSPFLRDGALGRPAAAPEAPFDLSDPEPQVDVEAERAKAFAEGRAEAEADLSRTHREEMEAMEAAHAASLAQLRDSYEKQAAAMIAERFSAMSDTMADLLASQAANVLAPVLDEVLTRKAVADLATMIRSGCQEGEGLVVTVKGPSYLYEMLLSHFEGHAPLFRHLEAADLDLSAEFGDTVLVTRMAAWADTVRRVLA